MPFDLALRHHALGGLTGQRGGEVSCGSGAKQQRAWTADASSMAAVRAARGSWFAGDVLQPKVQVLDQWPTSLLTNTLTHIGRLTADVGLELVELCDARQHRVLQDKLQLIEVELLRTRTVAVAQQTLD
jgi:hypothetical protein